jgi:hypothetical protein
LPLTIEIQVIFVIHRTPRRSPWCSHVVAENRGRSGMGCLLSLTLSLSLPRCLPLGLRPQGRFGP